MNERTNRYITCVVNRVSIMNRDRVSKFQVLNNVSSNIIIDNDVAFESRVTSKRFLKNITIMINNEVMIKKRKKERLSKSKTKKTLNLFNLFFFVFFTNFIDNSIDTIIVWKRFEKSSKTKKKFRESRVDFYVFFISTRFSQSIILFSRRFIRRAQMKTIKRFFWVECRVFCFVYNIFTTFRIVEKYKKWKNRVKKII